jgi:hypothetical protein
MDLLTYHINFVITGESSASDTCDQQSGQP